MRRNAFREAFCSTADEVHAELDRKEMGTADVYTHRVSGEIHDKTRCIEVVENGNGETVLFIESATYQGCEAIARACDIEVQ